MQNLFSEQIVSDDQQKVNTQSDTRYSFSEDSEALKAQQMESEGIDLSVGFDGYTENAQFSR